MAEICWANKKWNNIASDIKLVFYSSTMLKKVDILKDKYVVKEEA